MLAEIASEIGPDFQTNNPGTQGDLGFDELRRGSEGAGVTIR
jgi:hypothetical protein